MHIDTRVHAVTIGPAREEAKALMMGVLRDLRGVCIGTPNRRAYVMFFDWLYPDYLPMLVKAAELWWNDADVTVGAVRMCTCTCMCMCMCTNRLCLFRIWSRRLSSVEPREQPFDP